MSAARPRVLHLVDSFGLGGTQTILKDYFESRGSDASIHLYGLREVPSPVRIGHPNVSTVGSSMRYSLAPLGPLRRYVRDHRIDVLHCHLFRAQVFGFLLKALFFPGIALVFHEHGRAVGRESESRFEMFLFRRFLALAWRRVDHFICISSHTKARLLEVIPGAAARSSVIENPVPVRPGAGAPRDREALRAEAGVPPGAFVVGFASRLVERKGWRDFLEAFARVAPRLPVHFLLAGDGEDAPAARAAVERLGLGARGRLLGHIAGMADFYRTLDCFVMPSHWEPHGLAHLEAQGFGVPVVVSSAPGLDATVTAADALTFPPGDVEALAGCLERLAADGALRESLSRAGRANAARFTMDSFAAGLAARYAALAGAGADR